MVDRFLAVALLLSSIAYAVDVENPLSEKFEICGYIDASYAEWGLYNAVPSREFSIRRSGIELTGEITETFMAELKVEIRPDEVYLKDAAFSWEPVSSVRARIGQFKRETTLGGNISSWQLCVFDRPLVYEFAENLTYTGRDMGLDLSFSLPDFKGCEIRGIAGLFNGDERSAERIDNEMLYSFRGEIEIPSIDLTVGASAVSHRQGMEDTQSLEGYTVSSRMNSISADVSLSYKFSNWFDLSANSEFALGDNWQNYDFLVDVDPPEFSGYWATFTASYHPWDVRGIRTISLTAAYDYLTEDTELDYSRNRVSIIGAVYPSENLRFRFGGVRNSLSEFGADQNYTDFIAEIGLRF